MDRVSGTSCRRKARVELASVDMAGHNLQNIGAITGLVAPRPILMRRIEPISVDRTVVSVRPSRCLVTATLTSYGAVMFGDI